MVTIAVGPQVRSLSNDQVWQQVRVLCQQFDQRIETELPAPIRAALRFESLLHEMPIAVDPGKAIAGDFGWIDDEFDARANALEAEYRALLEADSTSAANRPVSAFDLLGQRCGMSPSDGGSAHTTVDYERVVNEGLNGIILQIEYEAAHASAEKAEYLAGMKIALHAVIHWSGRYAEWASKHAADLGGDDSKRLRRVANTCRCHPGQPARTFWQALQSVRLVHVAIGLSEISAASLSLGRLDQYLLPLYLQDLHRGTEEQEIESDLTDFLTALNRFGDAACNINIGGLDAHGADQFNPLSRLILKVVRRLQLGSPIVAIRVHQDTPDDVFEAALCPELLRIGQPTFYGEEPCRAALRERGIPEAQTHRWVANSCMGIMMAPNEWSDMWGSTVNVLTALELAINHGKAFHCEFPFDLSTTVPAQYATFEQLFETTCSLLDEIVELLLGETLRRTSQRGTTHPNPFVSSLLGDCIERGKDRLLGGCRYNTVIVEAFGLINTSDALHAIRRLVFEDSLFTLDQLADAARQDFEGHVDVLGAIRLQPKFGNDLLGPDTMARNIAGRFASMVRRHTQSIYTYAPSFHTLNVHIPMGRLTAASLDGRHAGEPLAKNVGVGINRSRQGPTALICSAAAISQREFFGGQALDLSVDAALFACGDTRKKVRALIQAYFQSGGLQIQLNGVTAEVLEDARHNPDEHGDLLVRIGGFSMPFVRLSSDTQEEMIRRFRDGV